MTFFSRKSKSRFPQVSAAPAPTRVGIPGGVGGAAPEDRIQEIGRDMLGRARGHKAGVLSAKFYSDKLMDWSMRDQNFKVQLFRFVDAFPMLKTPEAVHSHL